MNGIRAKVFILITNYKHYEIKPSTFRDESGLLLLSFSCVWLVLWNIYCSRTRGWSQNSSVGASLPEKAS